MDCDFNYSKIEKLNQEFIYEHIEQQLIRTYNEKEVLKVFSKKNDNLNFFLCDFEGIDENSEVDIIKESNRKSNIH